MRAYDARLRARWSALLASDPGLLRFRGACRTTLAFVLATAALGVLASRDHTLILAAAAGVTFAIMGGLLAREAAAPRRLMTLLAMCLASGASLAVTTLASLWPSAGETAFLSLLFLAVAAQSYGSRAVACGFAAVVDAYLALFLRATPGQLPSTMLVLPCVAALLAAIDLWIVRDRPAEALRRIVRTVERAGALLLHAIAAGDRSPGPAGQLRRRRLSAELNEVILAAEDQLTLLPSPQALRLSAQLLSFELALTEVAAAASVVRPLSRQDAARIRLAALRLQSSRASALRARSTPATTLAVALDRAEKLAAELTAAARNVPTGRGDLGAAPSGPTARTRPAPAWRPALRAGLAALLSMLGGKMLSPDRWFWAVLTVHVLFLGARSGGDTVVKGMQRLWGSLIGFVLGLLITSVLDGNPVLEGAGLVACVFGLSYASAVSPILAVFCVTVLLGLIYSLFGLSAENILLLRIEETAIGAAAAIVVGLLVWPTRSDDVVSRIGAALLHALADVVRSSARRLEGEHGPDPIARMREADRLFRDLRVALRPLRARRSILRWAEPSADYPAILACAFWVRVLVRAGTDDRDASTTPIDATRARAIADRLDSLADQRAAATPAMSSNKSTRLSAEHVGQARAVLVEAALDHLDRTLDVFAERFNADGWGALVARRPL